MFDINYLKNWLIKFKNTFLHLNRKTTKKYLLKFKLYKKNHISIKSMFVLTQNITYQATPIARAVFSNLTKFNKIEIYLTFIMLKVNLVK